MVNQQLKDIKIYQKIEWTIRNCKTLKADTRYFSGVFTDSHCDWELAVYREKEGKKDLALYLYVADTSNLAKGWSIHAKFTLTVVNQSSGEKCVKKKEMNYTFREKRVKYKCLEVPEGGENGFIRDNKWIVKVEFNVLRPAGLVDLKDLAGIKESSVPLLEDVFKRHPTLSDYKKNRIPQSRVTALNVLGQVLKFLNKKKWKDMKNEKSHQKLRGLWEELGKSGLDLSWLKHTVKSALDMEGHKTKEERENLKQKLERKKEKMEELEEKLRPIEKSVEEIRKDLEKADMKGHKKKEERENLKQKLKRKKEKMEELKDKLHAIKKSVRETRKDLEKAEKLKDKDLNAKIGYPKR